MIRLYWGLVSAILAGKLKIAVKLHEGDKSTTKIWRLKEERIYTKKQLEEDISALFPHLAKKGLLVNLYHLDDMVGRVDIESDADVAQALENFVEELHGLQRAEYLILHAEDTNPPSTLHAKDDPDAEVGSLKKQTKPKSRKVNIVLC